MATKSEEKFPHVKLDIWAQLVETRDEIGMKLNFTEPVVGRMLTKYSKGTVTAYLHISSGNADQINRIIQTKELLVRVFDGSFEYTVEEAISEIAPEAGEMRARRLR
jgi:hypothetical protein